MKYLQQLFLCFFMLMIAQQSIAQQDTLALQREARSFLREGNKLYNQQKFTDASVAYKKALGKNGNYGKANYNLGNALYQEKNYKEAVPEFELTAKTAKDKITKAEAYHNIGNAMMEQKQYQQAVDAYKNSLRNNPNDDETRYNLAVAQKMLKKEGGGGNDKDKNKDKNKDKKKDKNKDNQQNKDKNNDKGDKDKKKDKKDGEGDKKQDPNQQNKKNKKDQKQQPKPQQGKMSPQQVKQLLESLNNEEKKTQKKMNAKKSKGRKVKQEKDW